MGCTHRRRPQMSGHGYTGGRSRCFGFWQEFSKCHAAADDAKSCGDQKEDYIECLHHNKEIARAMGIKKHYLTTVADKVADRRREAEQQIDSGILGLGLLNSGDKA